MKKIAIVSIIINVLLLVSVAVLYNSNNMNDHKKEVCVVKGKKDIDSIIDKTDPIYIYKMKKFPCDSGGSSSYETNLCFGEKLEFADSLLTQVFKSKILLLNKYIKMDKEVILKVKDNTFFINALKNNQAQKENLLKSQKLWEQMRILNSQEVELACEGATGCSGFVSRAETDYVLKRIEEIKNINGYN